MPFPVSVYSPSSHTISEEFVLAALASLRVELEPSEQRAAHSELGVARRAMVAGESSTTILKLQRVICMSRALVFRLKGSYARTVTVVMSRSRARAKHDRRQVGASTISNAYVDVDGRFPILINLGTKESNKLLSGILDGVSETPLIKTCGCQDDFIEIEPKTLNTTWLEGLQGYS